MKVPLFLFHRVPVFTLSVTQCSGDLTDSTVLFVVGDVGHEMQCVRLGFKKVKSTD